MSGRERPIVARVEDADELGNIIAGTDRYASSVAPSSPVKEQPNTGRARRDKARRGSSSPITTSPPTDSDSTVHPRRDMLKKPSKDRDKSVSGSKKALMAASSRPPVKHAKTTTSIPPRRDDASYYGVDPTITPATSRPRAQTSRPSNYYGPTRPPPSNARFYAQPPPPSIPPSYPPPSWMAGPGSIPPPYGSPSPAPMIMQQPSRPPPSDYARPLESRFGSARPVSAMGFRPPRAIEYDDYEEPPFDRALARRPSASRKVSKHEEDRKAMPPPPRRPASARPTALAYRPPPPTPSRQKVNFEDLEPDLDDPLFGDSSPLAPRNYEYTAPIPFQPRPRFTDLGYDGHGGYHTEVAGKNRRRNSYYGGGQSGSSGSAYEDKLQHAASYQEQATGFSMPLTAETLRKAGKSGASSRSTRSSGSHDESDYRGHQSATTRTTRSTAPPPGGGAAADEDVTIRVRGSTVLKFGNTEMQCEDGAEINITSRGGNAATEILRAGGGGSDRSSFYAPDPLLLDDRRTRVDIPVTSQRARATSRARSRARSYSSRPFSGVYDASPLGPPPPMYPLEFDTYSSSGGIGTFAPLPPHHPLAHHPAPLPPPYPEYPSSYSSRHGGEYFPPPI